MLCQLSLWDSPSAISSQGSQSGPTPCETPAGPIAAPRGPAVALASLSARQAKELGLLTSGTCGQPSTTSSKSAALQQSLESRLRAKTAILGSTLYTLTWKPWVTPSGRLRFRLRASVRRTSETGLTGWPGAAQQAGWVTPVARDWKDTPGMVAQRDSKDRVDQLPRQAYLAGWATPKATDANGPGNSTNRQGGMALHTMAQLSGPARLTATGEMLTGSTAGMASGGQLSPAHSRWLMGCPEAWDKCRPNLDDWQKWQDWIASLSPEQKATALRA